jgi:hypothetical protein
MLGLGCFRGGVADQMGFAAFQDIRLHPRERVVGKVFPHKEQRAQRIRRSFRVEQRNPPAIRTGHPDRFVVDQVQEVRQIDACV